MRKLHTIFLFATCSFSVGLFVQQLTPDQYIPLDATLSKTKNVSLGKDDYLIKRNTKPVPDISRKFILLETGVSRLSIPNHMLQLDSTVPSQGLYAPIVSFTWATQKRLHCFFSQSVVIATFAQTSSYGTGYSNDPHSPGYSVKERIAIFSRLSFTGWTANLNLEFGNRFYWGAKFSAGLGLGGFYDRYWQHYYKKTTFSPQATTVLTEVTSGTMAVGLAFAFYGGAAIHLGYALNDQFAISFTAAENIWLLPGHALVEGYYLEDGMIDRLDPVAQVGVRYTFRKTE